MIKIEVQEARATCTQMQRLIAGMAGVEVEFSFDEEWDGLTKLAVFETSRCKAFQRVPDSGVVEIPENILAYPDSQLHIGVIGKSSDGATVIPTIYAEENTIKQGASTTPIGEPLTLSQAEQLQAQINALVGQIGGLSSNEKLLVLSLFKNAAYTADMSATISQLETLWSGEDVPDEPDVPVVPDIPEADVSQSGSILSIVSGVSVSQSGAILSIA